LRVERMLLSKGALKVIKRHLDEAERELRSQKE
jgi:hypothetical protein